MFNTTYAELSTKIIKDVKTYVECFFVFLSNYIYQRWIPSNQFWNDINRGNYSLFTSSNDIQLLNINIRVTIDITIYQYSTSTIEPCLWPIFGSLSQIITDRLGYTSLVPYFASVVCKPKWSSFRASTELGKYAPEITPQPNSDEIFQKAEKIPYILAYNMSSILLKWNLMFR